MIEWVLVDTAASFWESSGGFTDDLEEAVLFNLPVSLHSLEKLTLIQAKHWLEQRGLALPELESLPDRPLRACLLARGGACNFILVEATDPPTEQRYSLAHEVAHFLLDYMRPMQETVRKLGPEMLPVLTDKRVATPDERIKAVLAGYKLQPYRHFMERNEAEATEIYLIESRADRLALELLAPQELSLPILTKAFSQALPYRECLAAATTNLAARFNLPVKIADEYASMMARDTGKGKSFIEWLGVL